MATRVRICVAVATLAFAGACGGSRETPAAPPADAKRVDAATAGRVTGRVVFKGTVPHLARIDLGNDKICAAENPGGIEPEQYVVSGDGLENVFVYVTDGLEGYYFEVPSDPVKLDQRGCRFVPHVLGVRAGQTVSITNSDNAAHNVHALPAANPPFNKSQALKNMANTTVFDTPEVMVPVKCDIHPWMQAFVGVIQHPYFDVTHDGGRFELKDLPAGTYTILAWHEKLGTITQQVKLGPKESKDVTFTFQ